MPPSITSLSPHAGYHDLLTFTGLNVLGAETFGVERGDYLFAVNDPEGQQYGVLIVGYGSCVGCDVLRGLRPPHGLPWDPQNLALLEIYAGELRNSVHWGTRPDLQRLLTHPSFALLRWWGHEPTYYPQVKKILELIP